MSTEPLRAAAALASDPFYAYRMPGGDDVVAVGGCNAEDGATDGSPGFLVSAFDGSSVMLTGGVVTDINSLGRVLPFDAPSEGLDVPSTPAEHAAWIERTVAAISSDEIAKCVIARTAAVTGDVDVPATFESLCRAYPRAFVFAFNVPGMGMWVGATPELLLRRIGSRYESMALAGTRQATGKGEWDDKNVREHDFVVRSIREVMESHSLTVATARPVTLNAGPVEHLMTAITAGPRTGSGPSAQELAASLSPTPALCGVPRDAARELILRTEVFPRGCYGGYCGPVEASGNASLFVNLRSMRIFPGRAVLFAGGGIVAGSDPVTEWDETERKLATLLDKLEIKNQQQP